MVSAEWLQQEREKAAAWARDVLARGFLIVDGETTGLDHDDEFVQIGIVDHSGVVLLDTLVQPVKPVDPAAASVHGLTAADLVDAPRFPDLYPAIRRALDGRQVVAYNADFDHRILAQACWRYDLPEIAMPPWECAMIRYAQYHGNWSARHRSFTWLKLTRACALERITVTDAHTAAGDCLMTLRLIETMAASADPSPGDAL